MCSSAGLIAVIACVSAEAHLVFSLLSRCAHGFMANLKVSHLVPFFFPTRHTTYSTGGHFAGNNMVE